MIQIIKQILKCKYIFTAPYVSPLCLSIFSLYALDRLFESEVTVNYIYLIKTEVTKSVAMRPKQEKTTAAMGSGSPQRTYCTGMGSQPLRCGQIST